MPAAPLRGLVTVAAALVLATGCAATAPATGAEHTSGSGASRSAAVPATSPTASPDAIGTVASSSSPSPSVSAKSLAGRIIVIDPGHTGGWTSKWGYRKVPDGRGGTKNCNSSGTATRSGYSEHAYNWAQANALAAVLRDRGATVKFTRPDDRTATDAQCVNHRADIANKDGADLLISIHADGNTGRTHRGFHVIMSPAMHGGSAVYAKSTTLAADVRNAVQHEAGMPRSNYIGGGTGFSVRSDLGTLNFAKVPAVLVEMGNMMNAADAKLLASKAWRSKAADALADGIGKFLS